MPQSNPLKDNGLPDSLPKDLGALVIQVAMHELGNFSKIWNRNISGQTQADLFLEYAVYLLVFIDRLAFTKFGDPLREKIINLVVNEVCDAFARQEYFGDDDKERKLYFENIFAQRLGQYANCDSIMGESKNSLLLTGALGLVNKFLDDLPETQRLNLMVETGKMIGVSMTALLTTDPFKYLTK